MFVLRAQTSSGSTVLSPLKTMLLTSAQYGSTVAMKLTSASSNRGPYGWFRVGAACAEKSAFIPIAGFDRFENMERVWASATPDGSSARTSPNRTIRRISEILQG